MCYAIGCKKSSPTETKPTGEPKTPVVTQLEPTETQKLKVDIVDPKFKAIVVGVVFFVTEEDASKYKLDESIAEKELSKIPQKEKTTLLVSMRESSTGDEKIAAANLLAKDKSEWSEYKKLLLDIPAKFESPNNPYQQAAESWGDLMAEHFLESKDKEVLASLFEHDLDGAGAEIVAYNRLKVVLDNPELVLPLLNTKNIKSLADSFELATEDPNGDRETIALLAKSSNSSVAKKATELLKLIGPPSNSQNAQG